MCLPRLFLFNARPYCFDRRITSRFYAIPSRVNMHISLFWRKLFLLIPTLCNRDHVRQTGGKFSEKLHVLRASPGSLFSVKYALLATPVRHRRIPEQIAANHEKMHRRPRLDFPAISRVIHGFAACELPRLCSFMIFQSRQLGMFQIWCCFVSVMVISRYFCARFESLLRKGGSICL